MIGCLVALPSIPDYHSDAVAIIGHNADTKKLFRHRHAVYDLRQTSSAALQFYGNANENTKRLFRDRLKARATPTLALFDADGHMGHTHSGANKSRLEFYLREFIGQTDSETVYPPYQLTGERIERR